jgi:hypothetical protein
VIDIEYPGHESKIKEHLINLLQRAGIKVPPAKIQFDFVRKKSNAHKLAIETFNGKVKPHLVIHVEDVLGEFRK